VRRMNRFMWSGTNTRGTRNGPIGQLQVNDC
jgi:hypothetical protein